MGLPFLFACPGIILEETKAESTLMGYCCILEVFVMRSLCVRYAFASAASDIERRTNRV